MPRRVLVSDHTNSAAYSITMNLAEAGLHLLDLQEAEEQMEKKLAHCTEGGKFAPPRPDSAASLLPEAYSVLHVAGFFRAIGSVFDCMAATIVGAAAVLDGTRIKGLLLGAWHRRGDERRRGEHPDWPDRSRLVDRRTASHRGVQVIVVAGPRSRSLNAQRGLCS